MATNKVDGKSSVARLCDRHGISGADRFVVSKKLGTDKMMSEKDFIEASVKVCGIAEHKLKASKDIVKNGSAKEGK